MAKTQNPNLSGDLKRFINLKGNLLSYEIQEEILQDVVKNKCPDHSSYEYVEIKVKLLNLFYSTDIQATGKVARQIYGIKNIDQILAQHPMCSKNLVDKIANLSLSGKSRNNYSFATKYCALHQPDKYPIYDKIVSEIFVFLMKSGNLPPYQYTRSKSNGTKMSVTGFRNKLRDYNFFVQVYDAFRTAYGLTGVSYRKIDWYLWGTFKDGKFKSKIEKLAKIKKIYKVYAVPKINRVNIQP